ncbi:hypothetical protein WN944_014727 [Citrus x changshan-huyou]|uniref:Uncharacterized protein n=1 Tax=Citrus x changshan-huyou TaxID=2935761 RepID=A0AAP0QL05_9ROSI
MFCCFPYSDFEVDYESNENASIVYAALAVDKEIMHHDPKIIPCSFNFVASLINSYLDSISQCILDGIKMAVDSGLHPPLTVESDYFNAVKSILKKRLRMDDQR